MSRMSCNVVPTNYSDAKRLAVVYQQAKVMVNQAFADNNLGTWIVCFCFSNREKAI